MLVPVIKDLAFTLSAVITSQKLYCAMLLEIFQHGIGFFELMVEDTLDQAILEDRHKLTLQTKP